MASSIADLPSREVLPPHTGQISYKQEVPDPFERELYRPLLNGTRWITQRAQVIQSGSVNQYVGYIFLIVVLVLLLRLLP